MIAALALLAVLAAPQAPERDLLFADFEGADYGAWTVEGEAFGKAPARGTLPGQMAVAGFRGHGLVNSFRHGDASTGRLLSPGFEIARRSIVFRIGGGGHAGATCMNLIVDDKVVRTATGPNTEPGGSEALAAAGWDVGELRGRTARLMIVDAATAGWGHINVDHIVFTDRPPPVRRALVTRELVLDHHYLQLPVCTGSVMHRVALLVDGAIVREFEIELSDAPEWYADLDISAWHGRKASLRVDWQDDDDRGLDRVTVADERWNLAELHREALRPQLHWSPPRGWTNDPNGLVYAGGEFHLFYQHNPYGWAWGNMHWGHATSRDLVHWQDLPIAIYPRTFGDHVFSGSAVVDAQGTSGWQTGAEDLLVAAFTSTGRGECIAWSSDRGRTFTEYDGNPVLRHQGRDPRLLWHAPSRQWVMAVYDELEGKRWIAFHTSPDLRQWRYRSRIDGFFECPDLFALPLDGDASRVLWVLTAASSEYRVGSFDGATFTPQTPMLPGHRGRGFYAAQTFSHEPRSRVVQIGWLQAATPGMPFNQSMSLPHELTLRSTGDGPRLCWQPVAELASLRAAGRTLSTAVDGTRTLAEVAGPLELRATLTPGASSACGVQVSGIRIGWDAGRGELEVAGVRAPARLRDGKLAFTVFTDRNAVEVFAAEGLLYMPVTLDAGRAESRSITAFARGEAHVDIELHELRGIW